MEHTVTVRQLVDRVAKTWDTTSQYGKSGKKHNGTQHYSTTTVGQGNAELWDTTSLRKTGVGRVTQIMGHKITARQQMDRVVQAFDTTSQ